MVSWEKLVFMEKPTRQLAWVSGQWSMVDAGDLRLQPSLGSLAPHLEHGRGRGWSQRARLEPGAGSKNKGENRSCPTLGPETKVVCFGT